jgi:subtilisin family serine protease
MKSNLFVFLPDRKAGTADFTTPLAAFGDIGESEAAVALGMASSPVGMAFAAAASAEIPRASSRKPSRRTKVLEEIETNPKTGVSLVKVKKSAVNQLPKAQGGRFVPVVYYELAAPAVALRRRRAPLANALASKMYPFKIYVKDKTGGPVAGAFVTARYREKSSNSEVDCSSLSDANGLATLPLPGSMVDLIALAVDPQLGGHWGFYAKNIRVQDGHMIAVERIDLNAQPDALRLLVNSRAGGDGTGVTVAVIDTGVGPSPDLPNAIGDQDNGTGHGTHVAGIVGGCGAGHYQGIAPGVTIRSYRVFKGPNGHAAANYTVNQAISQAVDDGCDIINLSLRAPTKDEPVVKAAIDDAVDRGVLVVAAAGNDFNGPVCFPAHYNEVVAVSACGHLQGLPAQALDQRFVSKTRAKSAMDVFLGAFSNIGAQVRFIAPGTGIVSTAPNGGYTPMSGTSMACPAVVGVVARLLSAAPQVLNMRREIARRDAILGLALAHASQLGFHAEMEGKGLLK